MTYLDEIKYKKCTETNEKEEKVPRKVHEDE